MPGLYEPSGLTYNIKWIKNFLKDKEINIISMVHYMAHNGVTFCGKSDLLLTSSIVLKEVTCLKCLAIIIADKYKSFVKYSDVPVYLYDNVINAMLDFADELKERNMLMDHTPPPDIEESIQIYLKDFCSPFKISSEGTLFQEREGYSVWIKNINGRDVTLFAAPTYNVLYFETSFSVKK